MNSSGPDYKRIYKIQDNTFKIITPYLGDFYLTGGTALGRFYLNHRYSDDLDFFVNQNKEFEKKTKEIFNIIKAHYKIDEASTLITTDFIRINIIENVQLKIEFVNDIAFHWGEMKKTKKNVPLDNVANILANKLTALISRDEPKDVFDIISIAVSFHFNWQEIYKNAFKKQGMNETDIAMRFSTFPIELMANKPWLMHPVNTKNIKAKLETITDDFLFARDNSLGIGKLHILDAKPIE